MEKTTSESRSGEREVERWIEVDRWGGVLAGKQGQFDVELGDWLLAVRAEEVHRHLGFGSMMEYVERRVALKAHAAAERLRVAEILTTLAATREALRTGALPWSVVRELTRVAVADTEGEWLAAASGKTAREVEELVSGRRPGQTPSDPSDPRLRQYALHFEVGPEGYALFREAVRVLQRSVDAHLTEEEALQEMARRVLGGPGDEGRAPYQVALTRCEDCQRTWQDARGEQVEVPAEVAERAACDGQHLGAVDGASHGGRARATQTVTPALRRQVMRRDRGRCKVPGCRNATWLEVHHLRLQSEGGDHDPAQLAVLCGAHHDMLHRGLIWAEGDSALDVRFTHADGTTYGQRPDAEQVGLLSHAYGALRQLGFGETESKRALANIRSHVGRAAGLEDLVRAALGVLSDGMSARA